MAILPMGWKVNNPPENGFIIKKSNGKIYELETPTTKINPPIIMRRKLRFTLFVILGLIINHSTIWFKSSLLYV
ncbi:MAG: hypothetical protein ACRD9Q_01485 [Nitrososphaeraceae archaeon]